MVVWGLRQISFSSKAVFPVVFFALFPAVSPIALPVLFPVVFFALFPVVFPVVFFAVSSKKEGRSKLAMNNPAICLNFTVGEFSKISGIPRPQPSTM